MLYHYCSQTPVLLYHYYYSCTVHQCFIISLSLLYNCYYTILYNYSWLVIRLPRLYHWLTIALLLPKNFLIIVLPWQIQNTLLDESTAHNFRLFLKSRLKVAINIVFHPKMKESQYIQYWFLIRLQYLLLCHCSISSKIIWLEFWQRRRLSNAVFKLIFRMLQRTVLVSEWELSIFLPFSILEGLKFRG